MKDETSLALSDKYRHGHCDKIVGEAFGRRQQDYRDFHGRQSKRRNWAYGQRSAVSSHSGDHDLPKPPLIFETFTNVLPIVFSSSWMYSTALLGSPYLTYWYGIALPIWWANGQSTMICMFAWLAIQANVVYQTRIPSSSSSEHVTGPLHTFFGSSSARSTTYSSFHRCWLELPLLSRL